MGLSRLGERERQLCISGVRPELAIRSIIERKGERQLGSRTGSSRKTALVLQGGGMRGVFSAGATVPLALLGLDQAFDAVYGCSAGALNGAYFLAQQAAYGTSIYYERVANRRFIDVLRLNRMVDVDFVFEEVVARGLDVERVRRNPAPLYVIATDVQSGRELVFCSRDEKIDLLAALKASSAVPVVYHRPISVNGHTCFDGSLVDSIPVERAIRDGCTDILVVLTAPKSERARPPGYVERWVAERWLRPVSAALTAAYCRRHEARNRALDIIAGRPEAADVVGNVNIVGVFPDPKLSLRPWTKNVQTLKRAAVDGGSRVIRLFSDDEYVSTELIQFVRRWS